MIETKKDAQSIFFEALSAELDDTLALWSFARRGMTSNYSRKCESGTQHLRMNFIFKPSYQPGATGHIYPQITVEFAKLNQVALKMVGDNSWLLSDAPSTTFSHPIDFVIPKQNHIKWYTYGPETFSECVSSVKLSIKTWVIPFLEDYTTVESITYAYEYNDTRFILQKRFFIYVAAAYVILRRPDSAMHVLEKNLGRPAPRRDYAHAFEYVRKLL